MGETTENKMDLDLTAVAETTHSETATEKEGSEGFGLQFSTVAIQAFNLLILLVLLNFILFKPLLKMLHSRAHKIKEGIENAEKAEITLSQSKADGEVIIKSAKQEGQKILDNTKSTAEIIRQDLIRKAEDEAVSIIKAGQEDLANSEKEAEKKIKERAVNLVISAAEVFLKGKLDKGIDSKLIEDILKKETL